jgi:XRE family transcriptional regulator, regulator of sulfur utilization
MITSRRDLGILLPAVLELSARGAEERPPISSAVYETDRIAYKGTEEKKSRRFLDEKTYSGFEVEVHETVLGPGMESHPPHKHQHEEIIIVLEGTITPSVEGKPLAPATAGSVITYASNEMHNLRNTGGGHTRYYVIELRGKAA